MRSYAPTCTPDKAGFAVRLPFCLPQNGRRLWFLPLFEIEPTTDLLKKDGPSGDEGSILSLKGAASTGRWTGNIKGPTAARHFCKRFDRLPEFGDLIRTPRR